MKTIEDAVRELGGVWPFGPSHGLMYWDERTESYVKNPTGYLWWCTRTEFEECTRRLRNEPSWDNATDWAVAKAQDSDGDWYWYDVVPHPITTFFRPFNGKSEYAGCGEVIGDWRDTLRLRTEEKKMEDENDWIKNIRDAFTKNAEEFDSLLMAVLNRIDSQEKLEESEPTDTAGDWHAKGEFPPVGTVCEYTIGKRGYYSCTFVGINSVGGIVIENNLGEYESYHREQIKFRPLRAERERLIEKACKVVPVSGSIKETVTRLADAGMLKMPEDK